MAALSGGTGDFASYIGFLNLELYSIFFVLILGIVIAFIAASIISKEIESKSIDILLSNPISRKQVIIERFLGLIPMVLIINFFTMVVVYGITIVINESLDFVNLFITHLYAMPYFFSVIGIAILVSTLIDEKMKSIIIMIALLVGMFFLEYIANITPDTKNIGLVSLTHYYKPYNALKFGNVDWNGVIVLFTVTIISLVIAVIYFDKKDIKV